LLVAACWPCDSVRADAIQDSAGRSIDLPADVKSVVPAGPPAQILLHALAPAKLAGLLEPIKPEHVIYCDPVVRDLPQIPMLNKTSAPGDVGMVAALKPDLVLDYGSASARYVAADTKIQKELGVPAALFGGRLTDAAATLRVLGTAIGVGPRGAALAALTEDVLTRAKPLSELADTERVSVYLSRGADGLAGARSGTSFDEPIRLAGGRNVVEAGNGTFKRLTVEEIVALQPAVVIFSDRDALSSPLHAALPKGTRFILDTGEPYKVLTGPPSINRLVGLAALAAILHPEKFAMVPDDVARVETTLFPIPAGLAEPAPLQVSP
jgi:iron complex transport system substrate-binding protein